MEPIDNPHIENVEINEINNSLEDGYDNWYPDTSINQLVHPKINLKKLVLHLVVPTFFCILECC